MTFDEAKKVAEVAERADNNCVHCVRELAHALEDSFPEYVWTFTQDGYLNLIVVTERPPA